MLIFSTSFFRQLVIKYLSLVSAVRRQVEVSESGRSLVQRSPTECGASDCDNEEVLVH
jgi:hypothetical protein